MATTLKPHHQNPKPRRITPCHRHPDLSPTTTTTGLCASCLRERLSLLTPSTSTSTSTSSTAVPLPELRRCKTFSNNDNRHDSSGGASFEPRRRSCDVGGGRRSLSTLFDIDDDGDGNEAFKVETRNLGFLGDKGTCPVPEEIEEEPNDVVDSSFQPPRVSNFIEDFEGFEESKTMKEFIDLELQSSSTTGKGSSSSNRLDFKEIAGSFRVAASGFSKKLRKWGKSQSQRQQQQHHRSVNNADGYGADLGEMRIDKLKGRRLRDTQSEVGEYGFGRRSCDVDPRGSLDWGRASMDAGAFGRMSCDTDSRFSIDLGRASVDCGRRSSVDEGRCSFDGPRASWDGYVLGGRNVTHGSAPVVSVIENAMATVYGFDHRVLGEGKPKVENWDRRDSSSFNQMKDLSSSSSLQRRKKGLDGLSLHKRDMVVMENEEEAQSLSNNAKVSPTDGVDIFNGTKLLITEKELNEWRLNSSVKDDSSESFETASKDLASVSSSSNGNSFKKCRQWSKLWSIWGSLLHRKKTEQCDNEDRLKRGNVDCPPSIHGAHTPARLSNAETGTGTGSDPRLIRSHSTASSRGSAAVVGGGSTTNRRESKTLVRRRQDSVRGLDRSRSAKFPNSHLDNGMLRFYLTPLRSRRRSNLGKSKVKNSRSLARSVLRL